MDRSFYGVVTACFLHMYIMQRDISICTLYSFTCASKILYQWKDQTPSKLRLLQFGGWLTGLKICRSIFSVCVNVCFCPCTDHGSVTTSTEGVICSGVWCSLVHLHSTFGNILGNVFVSLLNHSSMLSEKKMLPCSCDLCANQYYN